MTRKQRLAKEVRAWSEALGHLTVARTEVNLALDASVDARKPEAEALLNAALDVLSRVWSVR